MGIVSKETNKNVVDGYTNLVIVLEDGSKIKFPAYIPMDASKDLFNAMIEAEKASPGQVFTLEATVHVVDHAAAPKAFAFAKPVEAKPAPKSRAKAA